MASVTVTLGVLADLAAEKASFGQPDWTVFANATNTSNTASVAAIAQIQNAPAAIHFLDYLTLSYSSAPTSVGTVTVNDGTTTIWTVNIGLAVPLVLHFDFSKRPLRSQPGGALTITQSASGGAVQSVQGVGHSSRSITAF